MTIFQGAIIFQTSFQGVPWGSEKTSSIVTYRNNNENNIFPRVSVSLKMLQGAFNLFQKISFLSHISSIFEIAKNFACNK